MSVDSKMTAIADQIRTLIGSTGVMGLDAMATNLTAANNAVNSAIAAIEDKGVTVPSGAGVADLASYIAKIVTGSTGYKTKTGSITPSAGASSVTITHGLGKTPVGALLFATAKSTETGYRVLAVYSAVNKHISQYISSSASNIKDFYVGTASVSLNASTVVFGKATVGSSSTGYYAALAYQWLVWG